MRQNIAKSQENLHNSGHRQRLRERLLNAGPSALQDYELLEMLLFMAVPRRDVKPLAKNLLIAFGSLSGVMNATTIDLMRIEGISQNIAATLLTVTALNHRSMKQELINRPILNTWTRLIEYCTATMAHEKREHFRILFLNKKNELLADEIQNSGTVDHTPAYPREILKRTLELGATAIIIMHNHPSGDSKPSPEDIEMTNAIIRAAEPFNIIIHDHVIIARKGYTSFRAEGLL